MKKIILILLTALLLTGCKSGVSQQEYDDLKSNYEKLQIQNTELNSKYDELEKNNEETKTLYEDYLEKYSVLLADSSNKEYIGAWGKTTFGDSTQYSLLNKDTAQLIIQIDSVTSTSIKEFYNTFLDNISTLAVISSVNKHNYIFIKMVDTEFYPVFELFMNQKDSDNIKSELLVGSTYYDLVVDTLN